MELQLKITEKNLKNPKFKTASELINAVCGLLDINEFKVYYLDHSLDSDENLIDDSDERD